MRRSRESERSRRAQQQAQVERGRCPLPARNALRVWMSSSAAAQATRTVRNCTSFYLFRLLCSVGCCCPFLRVQFTCIFVFLCVFFCSMHSRLFLFLFSFLSLSLFLVTAFAVWFCCCWFCSHFFLSLFRNFFFIFSNFSLISAILAAFHFAFIWFSSLTHTHQKKIRKIWTAREIVRGAFARCGILPGSRLRRRRRNQKQKKKLLQASRRWQQNEKPV